MSSRADRSPDPPGRPSHEREQPLSERDTLLLLELIQRKVRAYLGPRRHPRDGMSDFEDLVQDAIALLLRVLDRFDPDRGSLLTFAAQVIENFLKDYHRAVLAAKRNPGREAQADRRLDEISRDNTLNDRAKSGFQEHLHDMLLDLAAAIDVLPEPHRQTAHDGRSWSPSEVAEKHGIHPATVHRRYATIRRRWEDGTLGDYRIW